MKNRLLYLVFIFFVGCSTSNDIENSLLLDKKEYATHDETPAIVSMSFLYKNNLKALTCNVSCEVVADSLIEGWVPQIMDEKLLFPDIEYIGDSLHINNTRYEPDVKDGNLYDFCKPANVNVYKDSVVKDYIVYLHSYNGLPRVYIETEGRKPITSKETYLDAQFKMVEDVLTRGPGEEVAADIKIKGRGNATWYNYGDKKPYRIKSDKKFSLFNEPKEKSYVLLANAIDKTSLRNSTAFFMSTMSQLDYTPSFHFIDLFLNGVYYGLYQLGDKLGISENRVNVGADGFLIEIDQRAYNEDDAVYFEVKNLKHPQMNMINHVTDDDSLNYEMVPINIKEPDVEYGDEDFLFLKAFLTEADSVLFSPNFADPIKGWQKYMDMDSFVDWYLINELARNGDALFYTSCWMNLKRGGKLKMGPIWDFDTAFGNNNTKTTTPAEGFYVMKYASWYTRLFQDPIFVKRVKERFSYFYENRNDIYMHILDNADYLKRAIVQNNYKWCNLYNQNFGKQEIWGGYNNEVQSLRNWLERRFEWFKKEFDTKW